MAIDRKKADAVLRAAAEDAVDSKTGVSFRVVIEGVRSEYETPESFAIKFGIATSQPVTKVKHMVRSFPVVIWEGENRATAAGILSLIEEAGGRGRIDEVGPAPRPAPRGASAPESSPRAQQPGGAAGRLQAPGTPGCCPKCGFPAREGDEYCSFCMSPFEERLKHKVAEMAGIRPGVGHPAIPPRRLLIYVGILLAALLIDLIIK